MVADRAKRRWDSLCDISAYDGHQRSGHTKMCEITSPHLRGVDEKDFTSTDQQQRRGRSRYVYELGG
jgi:hypothetical protein